MMDFEANYNNADNMVLGAKARLKEDEGRINYVNARLKCYNKRESAWLFNVEFKSEGDYIVIYEKEREKEVRFLKSEIEYLKLRPFYFATCIGFKVFVFYAYE